MSSGTDRGQPADRIRPSLVVVLASLVAACAAPRGVLLPDLGTWERRQSVLAAMDAWNFNGRIAVKTGDDGFNGKLRWQQRREAFSATVSGPLGIGTVRIEGDGRTVALTDADGVRTELGDAELELRLRYGWTIPVSSLRYWALGIPDPALPYTPAFDAAGRLTAIEQRDWRVGILRYRDAAGQPMPNRLLATNADTRVRLVIDDWTFLE